MCGASTPGAGFAPRFEDLRAREGRDPEARFFLWGSGVGALRAEFHLWPAGAETLPPEFYLCAAGVRTLPPEFYLCAAGVRR